MSKQNDFKIMDDVKLCTDIYTYIFVAQVFKVFLVNDEPLNNRCICDKVFVTEVLLPEVFLTGWARPFVSYPAVVAGWPYSLRCSSKI